MHWYGYVEGKCGVMIPLTVGLTQKTMAAALRKWEVITCSLDLNHQAVGNPTEATLLQVTLEEQGVSVLGSFPTPLHTPRCNIGHYRMFSIYSFVVECQYRVPILDIGTLDIGTIQQKNKC